MLTLGYFCENLCQSLFMQTDCFRLFMHVCSKHLEEACLLRSNNHLGCTHRLGVFLPAFLLSACSCDQTFACLLSFLTGGLLFDAS